MNVPVSHRYSDTNVAVVVGALITIIWVALTWRYGLDVSDEGYYWYGSQRMALGEVPMRDFLSYDIGRYAWSATFMHLLGDDGVIGARMSAAVFRLLTVTTGVWLAMHAADGRLRVAAKIAFAALTALLLNLWAFPYYKVYDYGTSIVMIAMLALMIRRQTTGVWFGAGILLGLAAVIGRNHGMYGAFAAFLLLVFLLIKMEQRRLLVKPSLAFIAGVILGFSPNFIAALLIDGFAAAFMTTLHDLIKSGSANIGLPVPWPWKTRLTIQGWTYWGMSFSVGMAFIALLAVPLIALVPLLRRPFAQFRPLDQIMLSAAFGGLGYAHYAYSRADVIHLSHAMVGVLLLVLCFGLRIRRPFIIGGLFLAGSIVILTESYPFFAEPILKRQPQTIIVNGVTLKVFPQDKKRWMIAQQIFDAYPQGRNSFLALPDGPSLHAIAKVRMPVWEIYALSKRPAEFERQELARLDRTPPQLILLSDHALDAHSDMRFSVMHPLTYQWILAHYRRVPEVSKRSDETWQAYIRR